MFIVLDLFVFDLLELLEPYRYLLMRTLLRFVLSSLTQSCTRICRRRYSSLYFAGARGSDRTRDGGDRKAAGRTSGTFDPSPLSSKAVHTLSKTTHTRSCLEALHACTSYEALISHSFVPLGFSCSGNTPCAYLFGGRCRASDELTPEAGNATVCTASPANSSYPASCGPVVA